MKNADNPSPKEIFAAIPQLLPCSNHPECPVWFVGAKKKQQPVVKHKDEYPGCVEIAPGLHLPISTVFAARSVGENKVHIYTDEERCYTTALTLKELTRLLSVDSGLVRVHKQFIYRRKCLREVHEIKNEAWLIPLKRYLDILHKTDPEMKGIETIPVSKNKIHLLTHAQRQTTKPEPVQYSLFNNEEMDRMEWGDE